MTVTGPMQVPVVVVPTAGLPRDVVVECAATATVDEMTRILVPSEGADAVPPLFHARGGTWLRPQQAVGSIGLRAGDALVVGDAPTTTSSDVGVTRVAPTAQRLVGGRPASTTQIEIAVVGGPGTGRRVEVGPGSHLVGRDPGAALTVADARVSRAHLRIDVRDDGARAVTPVTPDAVVFVDGLRIERSTPLHGGEVVRIGAHALAVRELRATRASTSVVTDADPTGRVSLNRPPRPRPYAAPAPIAVPAPPEMPTRHHLGWGASLAPAIVGVAAWLLTGSTMLLLFMALSPIVGVWTFVEDGRRGHRRFRTDRRAHLARLDAAADRLATARGAERRARRAAHPDLVVLAERARKLAPDLWDRRRDDADFLELRIGTDVGLAESRAVLADGGDPNLRAAAVRRLDGDAPLADVPVAVALPVGAPLGISGPTPDVALAAGALLLQVATRHSPEDVAVVAVIADGHVDEWAWLDWLPHAGVEGLPGAAVVGTATGDARVHGLLRLVDTRAREAREVASTRASDAKRVVVLLQGAAVSDRAGCARLLAEGPAVQIFPIWLAPTAAEIPGECRTSVRLRREAGVLRASWQSEDGAEASACVADEASAPFARQVATTLAGIRDVTARRATGAVPRSIAFPDALQLTAPTVNVITTRWAESRRGLAAVIGAGADGPVAVDLRHDGPHALVAGTTGSGKSELLRTLIASLAATHPPERVNFLLVDYKGGAAFRECVELPHAVGLVTDLDHQLARRVLTSLDAEVKRREVLLHEARAKDLLELEHREPDRAPASLVIVVDEFAALVRDVPEFVDGVVDIAQRGRSLGVHLVLATQRPNGVVSENVRANANLRIALRVHEADDSRDVIGTAAAATIPRSLPGRAFLRTGPDEVVELQCAYAGGAVEADGGGGVPTVRAFPIPTVDRAPTAAECATTDLTRMVGVIRAAAASIGARPATAPWLPPLPIRVPLDAIPPGRGATHDRARSVALGLLDEPERQRQLPFVIDFESSGALAIVGAGGSGKTTALRTLAAALAATDTADAQIYAIDAAGHGLDPLAALPHCGAVVPVADADRVTALLAFLHDQLETRAAAIADAGVENLGELCELLGKARFPRLFLLLDGYGSFTAIYERIDLGDWISTLHGIVSEGRAVGIHVVITADRLHAVPASLTAAVPLRLLLRSADPDDALGVRRGDAAPLIALPAGRAVLTDGREVQIAIAGDGPGADDQRAALAALATQARARGVAAAPGVPMLPTRVPLGSLPVATARLSAVIALADRTFAARAVELAHDPFLVVGPRGSGRTTALATIASALASGSEPCATITVRPRDGVVPALASLDAVLARFEPTADDPDGGRLPRVHPRPGTVVLLDDGELAVDGPVAARIDRILALGATQPVRVVAAIEPASAARAFGGWVGELRRGRRALLLAPNVEVDGDLVGARLKTRPGQSFPPGRGFLVAAGRVELVQVALADPIPIPIGRRSVAEAVGGTPPLPTASTANPAGATIGT